jgi:hypothetical protein
MEQQGTFDFGDVTPSQEVKLCECECGLPAPIATENDASCGAVKGQARRFIRGHRAKGQGAGARERTRKLIVEEGQRFGLGVVVNPEVEAARKSDGTRLRMMSLRCACGTEYIREVALAFRRGDAESCGNCAGGAVVEGMQFDRLTVVKWVVTSGPDAKRRSGGWLCKCKCKNEVVVWASTLLKGHVKSCGCGKLGPRDGVTVDEAGLTRVIGKYEHGARDRGIAWELTRDDVGRLISSNCQYCGAAPATTTRQWRGGNAKFVYNGIDRIDNSGPYRLGNVLTACQSCNMAKRDRLFGDWADWAARFAAYQAEHPAALLEPPAAA